MKIWIGHYSGNTKEWFVVWANNKAEAWDKVDEVGDPDTQSFRELVSPGFANCSVDHYDEEGPWFSIAKDKARSEQWLFLGNPGFLQNPNDYVKALYSQKEHNRTFDMKIWLGGYNPHKKKIAGDCFIVWAKNKQDAFLLIDQMLKNADKDSLLEITDEGLVGFYVTRRADHLIYSPPKDEVENGCWPNLRPT